jgi:type IV secretory pathway VirB2 component (pilin)
MRRNTLRASTRSFTADIHIAVAAAACVILAAPAHAAGTNMPWEQPLNQILDSIQGPVAKVMSVVVIILTGLALAFGETSGGFRRLIQIVFGLSIAFAASSFFLTFFQFGGGALI